MLPKGAALATAPGLVGVLEEQLLDDAAEVHLALAPGAPGRRADLGGGRQPPWLTAQLATLAEAGLSGRPGGSGHRARRSGFGPLPRIGRRRRPGQGPAPVLERRRWRGGREHPGQPGTIDVAGLVGPTASLVRGACRGGCRRALARRPGDRASGCRAGMAAARNVLEPSTADSSAPAGCGALRQFGRQVWGPAPATGALGPAGPGRGAAGGPGMPGPGSSSARSAPSVWR